MNLSYFFKWISSTYFHHIPVAEEEIFCCCETLYSEDSILRMYGTTESIWTFPMRPAKNNSSRTSGCSDLSGDNLSNRFVNLLSPFLEQCSFKSRTALSHILTTCLGQVMPIWSGILNHINHLLCQLNCQQLQMHILIL